MKKVWLGGIVVALLAVFLWPVPQLREFGRQQDVLRQEAIVAEERQRTVRAAEAAQKVKDDVRARRAAIVDASDESLKSLYKDCRRKITEQIATGSKPTFAVHFPDYNADDLAKLSAMGSAMNTPTGRPSVILNRDEHQAQEIVTLRRDPSEISIIVESASDSFSGVKRWAAEYRCGLDGLSITSVSRAGALQFF
jgi:hypothetical protein